MRATTQPLAARPDSSTPPENVPAWSPAWNSYGQAGAQGEVPYAMHETLTPLRDPRLDQAEMLCDLIKDIRRILIQPMQNHVKLACIAEAVDELAPPPPPGE